MHPSVWLANAFLSIAGSIAAFFSVELTKKVLFATAAVAALLTLTGAFVVVVKVLLVGIAYVMPGFVATGMALLMPTNLTVCLSAIFSARVARWIYDYHMTALKLISFIR